MDHAFLEEWAKWKPHHPPYVFPRDKALLSSLDHSAVASFTSLEAYANSRHFLNGDDVAMHLGLHPIPMLGDLSRAKIIFLLLNPGLKPGDYYAEQDRGNYWKALRRSTQQKLTGVEYPFLFLDPAFSWHSGFLWWTRKLRLIIQRASEKDGGVKGALRLLANSVANIELYPYHSLKFKLSKRLRNILPSAKLAKSYVNEVLLRKARSGEIALVVMRRAKEWGVPSGPGVYAFQSGEARGAHLSKHSKITHEVLHHLGLG